jgi:hypothetical protein
VALALAIIPIFGATFGAEIPSGVGLVAVASLLAGVIYEWSSAIASAACLLALEYILSLGLAGAAIDARAPVIGAGLLLMTELAFWSIEQRAPIRDAPAVHFARARAVGMLVAGGGLLATLPLFASQLRIPGGLALSALGAVAAVALAMVLVHVTWRARSFTN